VDAAIFHRNLDDAGAFFFYPRQPLVKLRHYLVLAQKCPQLLLGSTWRKGPGFGLVVVFSEPLVELAGESANGRLVANISRPQSTRSQATDVLTNFRECHRFSKLHGRTS